MNRGESTQKTIQILKWGVLIPLFLALLSPLLFNSAFLFPFITTKTLYFRILIEVALFFYISLILIAPEYRPRMNKLAWAVVVYISVMTIASILGIDFYQSFWGDIERGEGLLTLSHVIAFWLMLVSVVKTKKIWIAVLTTVLSISVLEAGYAFMQKMGWMAKWITPSTDRIFGTIGNPAFLAAFLLLGIIIAFLLIPLVQKKWKKGLLGLSILFLFIIIYFTQTRGAVVAFIVGSILYSILVMIYAPKKDLLAHVEPASIKISFVSVRTIAATFLIFIILSVSVPFINKDANWVQNQPTLRRLTKISRNDITTQSRLVTWESSWKGWKDRFLLGYGYEHYNVAFNKYFNPVIFKDQGSQLWFDRAHNILFDQAVTGGVVGLISYLAIFALSVFYVLKILTSSFKSSKGENYNEDIRQKIYISIILIVGILIHLLQNLFVFDVLATYIWFYVLLAFVVWFINDSSLAKEKDRKHILIDKQLRYVITGSVLVCLVFGGYIFNIKPAKANMLGIEALKHTRRASAPQKGEDPALVAQTFYKSGFEMMQEAIAFDTYQSPELRQKMSEILLMAMRTPYFTNEYKADMFQYMIDEIKKNVKAAPRNVQNYMYLMTLYNASEQFDAKRLNLVITTGEKALELSPTRPQIYFEMGQAAISKGEAREGVEYFEKALELNPEPQESKWNLAAAYILTDQQEKAREIFDAMIEDGFDFYSTDNIKRLDKVYRNLRQYDQMIALYEEAMENNPDKIDFFKTNLGDLYAQKAAWIEREGNVVGAREAVLKAIELNPDLEEEGNAFLKLLNEK